MKKHRAGRSGAAHQIPKPPRNFSPSSKVTLLGHGRLSGVDYALYTTENLEGAVYASLKNPASGDTATEYGETQAEAMKRAKKAAKQLKIQENW